MGRNDTILIELQYFPPVQYFTKLLSYQNILIEQFENYLKGTYRNRCHIAGSNGVQVLSIPLKKGKNEQLSIRDVRISYDQAWQSNHWQTIQTAYGNSPFFEFYRDELAPFFKKEYPFLFNWNLDLLMCLIRCLSMDCELGFTKEYEKRNEKSNWEDWRSAIHPKKHRQKPDPHFRPATYAQVFEDRHGFLPNLSVLDLLFCMGPGAIKVLEKSNKE